MRPFGQDMESRCQVHYDDVIMAPMTSQITSLTVVYSIVYSDADQRKHQNSASLAFVWGIHRGPVNSPHKWPVTRKIFPFYDVIMDRINKLCSRGPSVVFADMLLFWEPVLIFSISFIAVCYLHCISRIAKSWSLQRSESFDIGCDISISVWPLLRVVSLTQVYTRSPLLSVGSLALIWSLCLGKNGALCCCQHTLRKIIHKPADIRKEVHRMQKWHALWSLFVTWDIVSRSVPGFHSPGIHSTSPWQIQTGMYSITSRHQPAGIKSVIAVTISSTGRSP